HSQSQDWVHLSKFQPDRRSDRLRERRTAVDLSRPQRRRADRSARARRYGASRKPFAQSALRRPAAACRGRAHALAGKPAILLADEPTGNLESKNGEAVMDLLKELHAGGATICMVTHDARFAQHADRTVHLFDGRVVEDNRIAA